MTRPDRPIAGKTLRPGQIGYFGNAFVPALAFCVVAVAVLFSGGAFATERAVLGYLENALLYPGAFPIQAKLDTGADHSSLDARIIKRERRKGEDWVIFEIENKKQQLQRFERQVTRTARVRRHSGELQSRPVVRMDICLGQIRREVDVNLVDRQGLNFKMLVGRSFMAGHILVDPSARFTTQPKCQ